MQLGETASNAAVPSPAPDPQGPNNRRSTDARSIRDFTDIELREELVVAAMARGRRRIDLYERLLAERDRRRAAHIPPR